MSFADERQAKEFAVQLILDEAKWEGVALSELERKMLYFSETAWTLPDMEAAAERFEAEYDPQQYERKIASLAKRLQTRLKSDDPNTLTAWFDALRMLKQGDHYLLVCAAPTVPRDRLKLWLTALLIVLAGVGLMALLPKPTSDAVSRERQGGTLWLIAVIAVPGFLLLRLIIGTERVDQVLTQLVSKRFGKRGTKR